jgi:hypothetical protein
VDSITWQLVKDGASKLKENQVPVDPESGCYVVKAGKDRLRQLFADQEFLNAYADEYDKQEFDLSRGHVIGGIRVETVDQRGTFYMHGQQSN